MEKLGNFSFIMRKMFKLFFAGIIVAGGCMTYTDITSDSSLLADWSVDNVNKLCWKSTGRLSLQANLPKGTAKVKEFDGRKAIALSPEAIIANKNDLFWQLGKAFTLDVMVYVHPSPTNAVIFSLRQSFRLRLLKTSKGVCPASLSVKLWNDAKKTKWVEFKSEALTPGWHRITVNALRKDKLALYVDGKIGATREIKNWNICSSPYFAINHYADPNVKVRKQGDLIIAYIKIYDKALSPQVLDRNNTVLMEKIKKRGCQVIRRTEWSDYKIADRINYSPAAVVFSSGTFSDPPWSPKAVVQAKGRSKTGELINTNPLCAWNTGTYTSVSPEKPFLQIDFPYDEAVEFDTIALISNGQKKSPEFRPPYYIERRLGEQWDIIFEPLTQEESGRPFIRFDKPVKANAIRLVFINPSPDNYWGVSRLWVFGKKKPTQRFKGGDIDITTPGIATTEGKPVFKSTQVYNFNIKYNPKNNNLSAINKLKIYLTDYYRHLLTSVTAKAYKLNTAKVFEADFKTSELPPGPYYLCAEIWNGDSLLMRKRLLFGIAGVPPSPKELYRDVPKKHPYFQIAGAVGQFDGTGQFKAEDFVDAFDSLDVNTMQVEMFWADLEPLPGVYNFQAMDRIVKYVIDKDKMIGITIYLSDNQAPDWMRQDKYVMRDQYGNPARGRNKWKMNFFSPPSPHSPLFKKHFRQLWKTVASRYSPTGRILRFDIRPPQLETFYFDEYVNNLWTNGKTDTLYDFSEWARLDFIDFLRDYRGYSLKQINDRYGKNWKHFNDIQLPKPLPAKQRVGDLRPEWVDFEYFKKIYTIQDYFLGVAKVIDEVMPDVTLYIPVKADDSPLGHKLMSYIKSRRAVSGNFSIEHGNSYFTQQLVDKKSSTLMCYEWGQPAPTYYHFNAGLFYIFPTLKKSSSLRWVASPCMGGQKYNSARFWKSWASLSKMSKYLPEIAKYSMAAKSQIALIGKPKIAPMLFDGARPISRKRRVTEWDRWILNMNGGLEGVLKTAQFYNGLVSYKFMTSGSSDAQMDNILLAIDGGNPNLPEILHKQTLDFVRKGGKLLMWSNSFRFDGTKTSRIVQKALGISGNLSKADESVHTLEINFPNGSSFSDKVYRTYQVNVPEGKVIGTIDGKPAAWLIPFGKGETMLINGLPVLEKADGWVPFMAGICDWAKITPTVKVSIKKGFKLPNLLTYPLIDKEGKFIFPVFNCSPMPMRGTITYHDIINPVAKYKILKMYSTEDASKLISYYQKGNDLVVTVKVRPLDMIILQAAPISRVH